jgi:prepilin-type N-terminal cleavage/methylation domain-containing protein
MKSARAFSLIELLIVIAIIALIAGLALPALVNSRRTAQNAAGQVNMRSMHQVQMAFTVDHKGEFYNPFAGMQEQRPLASQRDSTGFTFGFKDHSRYTTEGFMAYWYAVMAQMHPNESVPLEACVSPADGDTMSAIRNANTGTQLAGLAPGSFYYSPVFWRPPEMYDFTNRQSNCCASEFGSQYRGDCCDANCDRVPCCGGSRNGIEMVGYPSSKVLLYERADFGQRQRSRIDGGDSQVQMLPPAWNNPRARPNVIAVDGSIVRADIQDLTVRAADALANDRALTYLPVDLLNVPDKFTTMPDACTITIDGHERSDGLYPMFFAATRYGMRGRDLAR